MSQGTYVTVMVFFLFLVYITARKNLTKYMGFIIA